MEINKKYLIPYIYVVYVPISEEARRKLKAKAALEGKSMKEYLIELVEKL